MITTLKSSNKVCERYEWIDVPFTVIRCDFRLLRRCIYYSGGGRISCKWQNTVSGVHATIIIESSFLKFCEKAIYHINIYLLSVSGFGNIIRVISLIFSRYHILKRYRLWSARVQYNSPIELCVNRSELLCRILYKRRSDSAPFFAINHPRHKISHLLIDQNKDHWFRVDQLSNLVVFVDVDPPGLHHHFFKMI